ncbi:MAG: transposase family protein [Catalinimonas sp.]
MFCLFENVHNDRQFLATTGLDKADFKALLTKFEQAVSRAPEQRPGPEGCLTSLACELFFGLFYLKTYPTFDVLGLSFGIEGPAAQKRLMPILAYLRETLRENKHLPARSLEQVDAIEQILSELEQQAGDQVWIDGTERESSRPKDDESQKARYSGKKRYHTYKNLLLTTFSRLIIFLSPTVSGSVHDYKMLKTALQPGLDWFKGLQVWLDLGFQGFAHDYECGQAHQPIKKPRKSKRNPDPHLTEEQKEYNRQISKVRVLVENVICGLKRYQILVQRFRNRSIDFADQVMEICAGLWNFRVSCKSAKITAA